MSPELVAIWAKISAVNAQVEGMKAANQQRAVCDDSIAYTPDYFEGAANDLEQLASMARSLTS